MVFQTTLINSQTKLNLDLYLKSLELNDQDEYIIQHCQELLPDWVVPPRIIIFIFFQCQYPLDGTDLAQEQLEKDRFLSEFNQLGWSFYSACHHQGILSEIICPKDGLPKYSSKGKKIFNIQSLVARHLPLFNQEEHRCGLIHPCWGRAVYPCLMLSLASEEQIKPLIWEISKQTNLIIQQQTSAL